MLRVIWYVLRDSMTLKFRIPYYLASHVKREIGELYVATGIAEFALAMVLVFEPIFLFSVVHLSVPQVLLFFGAVYAWYVLCIPFGAKFASRFGYRHAIVASITFQILYWLLLFGSQDNQTYLYLAPLALALEKSLYWPAFHALIARFAHHKQVGREFSVEHSIINLAQVLGPFVGGIIGEYFGLRVSFIVAIVVYISMFVPLMATREVFIPKIYQYKDTWEMYKAYPKKMFGYFGFAEELLVLTVWPIFIYTVIHDYQNAGLLVTVSTLVAMVTGLYIGKVIDKQGTSKVIRLASILYALAWFLRVLCKKVGAVFITDALSRTTKEAVFVPLSTATYKRAEATHIMPYVVFFEQSLALGKMLAASIGCALFLLTGESYSAIFIFAGLASFLYMLI